MAAVGKSPRAIDQLPIFFFRAFAFAEAAANKTTDKAADRKKTGRQY